MQGGLPRDFKVNAGGVLITLLVAFFCQGGDCVSNTTLTKPSG